MKNSRAIRSSIEDILGRDAMHADITFVDNYDWFKDVTLLDFLRDAGKFARLGTMLAKDSVRSRLESDDGLSFTEFSYQLLQGYDFMHLFKKENVSAQIGGSDQWGNITAGTELIRRVLRKDGAHGLTFPLLLKSDGSKFGKSASGAIWLSKEKLSPYKFYQHLLTTDDRDVIRLLRMLTFIPLDKISAIENDMVTDGYVPNTAQRILAEHVTQFVHGVDGLHEAFEATKSLRPGSDTILDAAALKLVSESIPSATLDRDAVVGSLVVDVMAASGLLESKGAAKRMVRNGGIRVNNVKVTDESQIITSSDLIDGEMILLAAGKKNKLLLHLG
jgi:tyrosyl-tRNA synthetase